MGALISISRNDVVLGKTYGVFTKSDAQFVAGKPSTDINIIKYIVIGVSSKIIPQIGDYIIYGNDQWYVTNIETYRPTNITLGYKLTIS